jgi:hypothetical protein
MSEQRPLHRLFGLFWLDFFRDSLVQVEMEKDLSLRQQRLDLVIIRTQGGPLLRRLPDGFEDLAPHNLVSFKSFQEALDAWALTEHLAHFVNYRKQVSPTMQDLLPVTDFRLFAVCTRFPRDLALQVKLEKIREGVFEVRHFMGVIRVVVINQLPPQEHNAMLLRFSSKKELEEYGVRHGQLYSTDTSTLLYQLFERYRKEGLPMIEIPLSLEELRRETIKEILDQTPHQQLLERLSPEERLEGLSPEKRLEGLSPDDLLKALTPEVRAALTQRLKEEETPGKPQ